MEVTFANDVGVSGFGAAETAAASPYNAETFMQLLLAQLRNQDPLNPLKDNEFMSQISQLQMSEQIRQMNETAAASARMQALVQGVNFIGRQVQATTASATVQGVVESVRVNGDDVLLDLGTAIVRLADVQIVKAAPNAV